MIRVDLDDAKVKEAMAKAGPFLGLELSRTVNVFVQNGYSDFKRVGLNAPDDRKRSDFLLRRPPKSLGLRHATGELGRAFYAKPGPVTPDLSKLSATTGFLTGRGARIARVHELGTVRYGGSLPDIIPKRAKLLRIPLRNGTASRGTKILRYAFLKKVGIPPRLGLIKYWTSKAKVAELRKRAIDAATRAIKKAAAVRG